MVAPLHRKLGRDLWRLRSQVLTIALVVASGLGGFIGSLSTYDSMTAMRDAYYDSGRLAHVFVAAKRAPLHVLDKIRRLPDVVDAEASVAGSAMVTLDDVDESMAGRVIALPPLGLPRINRLSLRAGHWLAPGDDSGALVSEAFARARGLEPGDEVTLLINGRFERVRIRGIALSPEYVFAAAGAAFADDTRFGVFWLSHARLAAAYDMEGAFNAASLRLARNASAAATIAAVDGLLAPYGSTGAHDRADQPSVRALNQEIGEQRVFGTVLPAVFLGVAVFLLNVLLSRHIATERTQIAALKALGYDDRTIGMHYLVFVLVIAVLGVVLGLAIGVVFGRWMTELYTRYFFFPSAEWRAAPWIVLSGAGIALAAAVTAAVSAVRRVVRLAPAEAMRPPGPARFRRLFVEWIGVPQLLSGGGRMVMRELERRPFRSSLTVLGVASAIAIIVGGTWWDDAFDVLLEEELQVREKADVLVVLTRSVAPSALHEAARLPGVLAVEGTREVPVRLINGHLSYRTALSGIDHRSSLRPVIGRSHDRLRLPEDALVLTDRLSRKIGIRAGESVWVEPLEGRRHAHLMSVALEAGDLIGMRAYATREAAAALVDEEDTVNFLRFRIDRARLVEFMRAAREIPLFATVGDKTRLIRHFRDTSQRNLLVFTGILSAFAACIAVGVVYNSARIALAERAWELATLRVLGFTRGEVSSILLGQIGVQVLIAIPLGCLLGYGLAALLASLIEGEEFEIPLVIRAHTYAIAILVTLAAGFVSAFIVRQRIDRLDLVGVLKTQE
jgi:putative ABC transport system permease protein